MVWMVVSSVPARGGEETWFLPVVPAGAPVPSRVDRLRTGSKVKAHPPADRDGQMSWMHPQSWFWSRQTGCLSKRSTDGTLRCFRSLLPKNLLLVLLFHACRKINCFLIVIVLMDRPLWSPLTNHVNCHTKGVFTRIWSTFHASSHFVRHDVTCFER